MKIKAYTGYSERSNTRYYNVFEVVDKLPKIGEVVYGSEGYGERQIVISISKVTLDCEQGNDEVYNYDYYIADVIWQDLNDNGEWVEDKERKDIFYYAIERKEED